MLLLGGRGLDLRFAAHWTQSHEQDNSPLLGQLAPQGRTYMQGTHHCCEKLGSSP